MSTRLHDRVDVHLPHHRVDVDPVDDLSDVDLCDEAVQVNPFEDDDIEVERVENLADHRGNNDGNHPFEVATRRGHRLPAAFGKRIDRTSWVQPFSEHRRMKHGPSERRRRASDPTRDRGRRARRNRC